LKRCETRDGRPLYWGVACMVEVQWNRDGQCGLGVGATFPQEIGKVRERVGDMPLRIPGIGAQGGSVPDTVRAGRDSRGLGMMINSSRAVLYASKGPDWREAAAEAARATRDAIQAAA